MNFFEGIAANQFFISAALGWLIAQVLKTIIHTALTKTFVAERMVGSGGMPSSHSSTVCALATSTYFQWRTSLKNLSVIHRFRYLPVQFWALRLPLSLPGGTS